VAQEADIASRLTGLLRDFVARQLSDGRCLRLDGHLAVSLRNIARTVPLNGIQDAVLNSCLNADCLEAMPRRVAQPFDLRGGPIGGQESS
jgi:hypothetical protein